MTLLPYAAILAGLAVLVWSADRFVLGAAALARRFGMPPLLIGMLIIGFGTSAPEMIVSVLAALAGRRRASRSATPTARTSSTSR